MRVLVDRRGSGFPGLETTRRATRRPRALAVPPAVPGRGRRAAGMLGVGRSRARVFDEERPSTTFADVAGYEGARAEIAEVVDFLRDDATPGTLGAWVGLRGFALEAPIAARCR